MLSSKLLSTNRVVLGIEGDIRQWLTYICLNFKNDFVVTHGYADVDIDPKKVHIALRSWVDDLDRYSLYHRLDPSPYKVAAHLVSWVSKVKPIFRLLPGAASNYLEYCSDKVFEDKYDWINEAFALELGLHVMGRNPADVDDETMTSFMYLLCFRDVNPKHLSLTLEQLDKRLAAEERLRQ